MTHILCINDTRFMLVTTIWCICIIIVAIILSFYDIIIDNVFIYTSRITSGEQFHILHKVNNNNKYIIYFPGIFSRESCLRKTLSRFQKETGVNVLGFMYTRENYMDAITNVILNIVPKCAHVLFIGFSYGGVVSMITLSRIISERGPFDNTNLALYKTFDNTFDLIKHLKGCNRLIAFLLECATFGKFYYDNTSLLKHLHIDSITVIVNTRDEVVPCQAVIDDIALLPHIKYMEESVIKSENYVNCQSRLINFLYGYHMYLDFDIVTFLVNKTICV